MMNDAVRYKDTKSEAEDCKPTKCNDMSCRYCSGSRINKAGFVNKGNQRYLCRDCKKTFTITK